MSKVYEALKRAQEDRSLVSQDIENVASHHGVEMRSPAVLLAPPARNVSTDAVDPLPVQPVEKHSGAREIETPPAAVPAPSSLPGSSSATASVAAPLASPNVERRPQAPAIGRDPRTGQFLRFEDLLTNCAKPTWVLDPRVAVFCESNRKVTGAEQFRTLRTRLYQLRETSPLKKVLVTSAVPGEGKTFVASNLAQAIARERGRRVLLIDADLRNPSLHLSLGAPLSLGLCEYLRDQARDAEIVQHGQEGNLCFIASGKPGENPSELLSNGELEKLLDRLAPLFDWVIIDSPPCLPVADANLIANLCDGVLLVVRARSTSSVAADRARKELQKRRVIGVVMNAVEEVDSYGSGYYPGYGAARARTNSRN